MTVMETAERMLPSALRPVLAAQLQKLGGLFSERSERAATQRMALTAFSIRILSAAIAFISQIVLARLMGEFEYGIFVFVWVLIVLIADLSCLGFHTAIIRFLPQYRASGALEQIRGLTRTARIFALSSSGLLMLSGIAVLHLYGDRLDNYYLVPVLLSLFTLPMIALGDVLEGTSRANHWAVMALGPIYLLRPFLIILYMVAAVLVLDAPHTAITAMQAALAATFTTTLLQYVAVMHRLKRHVPAGPLKIDFLAWLSVAFPIFLIEGFGYLLTNSDVVVVGILLPPQQVAVYFAAAKTMALVHFINFSVRAAAGPRFSAIIAAGNREALAAAAIDAARWTFWPALFVGIGVLLLGEFLLSLFGNAFTSGYMLMAILLSGILLKAIVGPADSLLIMAGQQKLCVWLYAAALASNVALNIVLVPIHGVTGAAIATASAMVLEAVLLHLAVRHALGFALFAFAPATAREA